MDFEIFWSLQRRKEAKKDARRAWEKLTARQQEDALKAFPLHLEHWEDRETKYVPLPASWLNAERWTDELERRGPDVAALMRQLEAEGR